MDHSELSYVPKFSKQLRTMQTQTRSRVPASNGRTLLLAKSTMTLSPRWRPCSFENTWNTIRWTTLCLCTCQRLLCRVSSTMSQEMSWLSMLASRMRETKRIASHLFSFKCLEICARSKDKALLRNHLTKRVKKLQLRKKRKSSLKLQRARLGHLQTNRRLVQPRIRKENPRRTKMKSKKTSCKTMRTSSFNLIRPGTLLARVAVQQVHRPLELIKV